MREREKRLAQSGLGAVVVALTFVATALRVHGLFANSLHADEALFATWARLIGTWRAPLLGGELVDKPPLLFYIQASLYPLLGTAAPWVARLPNLAASILVTPLAARLVWTLFKDGLAMLVTAVLVTFSPLLVQFSATAFTDPLLTTLVLASLVAAAVPSKDSVEKPGGKERQSGRLLRPLAAGLCMGLALATKYQGFLFLPLQVVIIWLNGADRSYWRAWLGGVLAPAAAVALWQAARNGEMSLWSQQLDSFGGLRLAWSWELWTRLEAWGALWGGFIGTPVLAFALLLFTPVFLALLIQRQDRPTALDQVLLLFLLAYSLLHWFVAVPVWDRYLLPIAPLAAVLLGRFVSRVLAFLRPAFQLPKRATTFATPVVLLAIMAPAGVAAREAAFPVGAQQNGRAGVAMLSEDLAHAPFGTVLYVHWDSWQWRYHLMDSGVYVSWFMHPAALLTDLEVFFDETDVRYLALPSREVASPVRRALLDAGYELRTVRSVPDIILYQIEP